MKENLDISSGEQLKSNKIFIVHVNDPLIF